MAGKDVRNLILALILLIVGMQLIVFVLKMYMPKTTVPIDILNFDTVTNIVNGFSIAVGVIVILLIPVYIYAHSKDNKKNIAL